MEGREGADFREIPRPSPSRRGHLTRPRRRAVLPAESSRVGTRNLGRWSRRSRSRAALPRRRPDAGTSLSLPRSTSQARGPPPLPRRRLTDDGRRHPRPSEAGRPGIGRPASGRLMKECHDRCRFPRFPSFLHAAGGVGLRLPSVCGPTAIVPANHKPRLARLAATGGRRRGGRRGGAAEREVDSPCSVSPSTSTVRATRHGRRQRRAKDAARTDD